MATPGRYDRPMDTQPAEFEAAPATLYVLSTCPVCARLKRLLDDNGVAYAAIDVDMLEHDAKQQAMRALKRVNPMMSFPTIVSGDTVIAGFQREKVARLFNLAQPPSPLSRLKGMLLRIKRGRQSYPGR